MHILAADTCTLEALAPLLAAAGLRVQPVAGALHLGTLHPLQLQISRDQRLLRLLAHFAFSPHVDAAARLDLANRINHHRPLPRAAIDKEGDLALDHALVIGPGLSIELLLTMIDMVDHAVPPALALDTGGLLATS